jgi:hypothetical protein
MRSGGIFAGNVDFEILYVPSGRVVDQARVDQAVLYGVVFEAWGEDAGELAQRGIAYLPAAYKQKGADGSSKLLWMNYFLESFWPATALEKMLFGLKKLVPDPVWLQQASAGDNAGAVQWMFNQVYRHGVVFLVKYNPDWRDIQAERRISKAQLETRSGGVLGLIRVKEVAVGTTQLTESSARWRKLLRPALEETGLCWQVGDGPALRVMAAERDG